MLVAAARGVPAQQLSADDIVARHLEARGGAQRRRAHPDVDTRAGMEVIGFQMLKMGDHAGAIALLRLNATDYPQSSTSAFGLGRAYQTAGDSSAARREQRALRLDPGNKRAADELAELR